MRWSITQPNVRQLVVRPQWARLEREGKRVFLSCGDCNFVDAERVDRLHALLAGVMTPETRTVILDLRDMKRADTKLMAGLVAAVRRARKCGVRIVVYPSPAIRNLIEMCRLEQVIAL